MDAAGSQSHGALAAPLSENSIGMHMAAPIAKRSHCTVCIAASVDKNSPAPVRLKLRSRTPASPEAAGKARSVVGGG
jgi:hypothetical protein